MLSSFDVKSNDIQFNNNKNIPQNDEMAYRNIENRRWLRYFTLLANICFEKGRKSVH